MKNLISISLLMLIHLVTFAQSVAINETGLPAEPTSLLDISSTTKGLLIPRMRTIERVAIVSPAEGLFVYDIDTHTFWYNTNSTWKEILKTGDGGFSLPYVGVGADPDKLFSITNNSASPSTAIFGRILGGSGLGLSGSHAVWGDNQSGNGVSGTSDTHNGVAGFSNSGIGVSATSISGTGLYANSTTGYGISSISQTNFGLASVSNGVDKPGVLGVNGNNTGAGYGVIGMIENTTGGAGVWGKNNAIAGHAGLFTIGNITNLDPALKASSAGAGYAAYITMTGTGQSLHVAHNNPANTNTGLAVYNNSAGYAMGITSVGSNTTDCLSIDHLGSGRAIHSKTEMGQAGVFKIINDTNNKVAFEASTAGTGKAGLFKITKATNSDATLESTTAGTGKAGSFLITNAANSDAALESSTTGTGKAGLFKITNTTNLDASLESSTLGKGKAAVFIKNNTTGSNSDLHDPAVYIDNNSLGAGLKVYSHHSNSVNYGVNINYEGLAFGLGVSSNKGAILASTTGTNTTVIATNYNGGMAIKGIASGGDTSAVYGETSGAHGAGVKGFATHALGIGVLGQNSSDTYAAVTGVNNKSGGGVEGIYNGTSGIGYGVLGEIQYLSEGIAAKFSIDKATNPYPVVWTSNYGLGPSLSIVASNENSTGIGIEISQAGTGKFISFATDSDEKISIGHQGNVITDGTITTANTVTVKNNKGIVRNSTSTQMRMETVSLDLIYFNMPVGGSTTTNVNFATAFSSPPVVSLGNIDSGFTGPCDKMTVHIKNVTSTGCTVTMYNPAVSGNPNVSGTWHLLVVGAE